MLTWGIPEEVVMAEAKVISAVSVSQEIWREDFTALNCTNTMLKKVTLAIKRTNGGINHVKCSYKKLTF